MSLAPAYPLIVILIHSDEMLKVFYTNRAYFFVCNYALFAKMIKS